MGIKLRTAALAIGVLIALLCIQPTARADQFQFSFQPDPVGCVWTISCGNPESGGGVFTTDPLMTYIAPVGMVYIITSINGQFNGFNMSLIAHPSNPFFNDLTAGGQLDSLTQGIEFTANGKSWAFYRQDIPHPAGTDDLVCQLISPGVETCAAIDMTITPISTPEPSSLLLLGVGMLTLVGLSRKKAIIQTGMHRAGLR